MVKISKKRIVQIAYLIFFITICILFTLSVRTEKQANPVKYLERLQFQGTYRYDLDSMANEIDASMYVNPNHQRMLILEGHFNRKLLAGDQLIFRLEYLSIEIYQNDTLIYSYGTKQDRPFYSKSGGNTWMYFFTDGIARTDTIRIILRNPYTLYQKNVYKKFLSNLYTGDKMSLFRLLNQRMKYRYILCFVIIIIGVLMLAVSISFYISGIEVIRSTHWCSLLVIAAGIWGIMQDASLTLILPIGISLSMLSNMILFFTATLKIRYDTFFMSGNRKRILMLLFQFSLMVNVLSCVLQFLGLYSIIETCLFIIPFSLIITIIDTVFLFIESTSKHSTLIQIYLASGVEFVVFCSAGTFIYFVLHRDGSIVILLGFFFFAIFQFVILAVRFAAVLRDSRRTNEMEMKILQNNIAITLTQIRPHFLFNVLTAIQQLCEMNPERAKQAIEKFSFYLRGNLDSLTGTGVISFHKEIEHVKYYLDLEELRFSGRLHVKYDLQAEDFFLPALSIQPIVENAVKHGVTKRKEGGTVLISTRLVEDMIVIQVEDDGVGFDVAKYQEEHTSHIGIENVSNRLKNLCDGTVEIQSKIGIGTIVTMKIPSGLHEK